jgi:hypothetical protein
MLETVKQKELLEKVKGRFEDAVSYDRKWQEVSRESFGFRDSEGQWTREEKDILHEEMRPALTLNVVKAHVDLVKGLNEDIKKRFIATPIGVEDSFLCEVLNNVIYWMYRKGDYESEEDLAFESSLICGRGWVGIDYTIDEQNMNDIKVKLINIPVHEVHKDPASRRRDLSDSSYIFWDRWYTLEDFAIKYPKFEQKAREAFEFEAWPKYPLIDELAGDSFAYEGHDINDESDYSDPLDVNYFDTKKKQIRVVHMEYWKYVKKYHVYNYDTGTLEPINIPWKLYKEHYEKNFPGKKLRYETTTVKEVWWCQFCGEDILYHGKSPINYPGYSVVPCFMFEDVSRRSGNHFGIVELMKDPQREINKRTSQTLNLFNQQVQPGVYAESRAFQNVDQAEQSLKESGSVTWLQDGAIAQQRFQERSVPTFPTAVLQMGEYAREMLRHITGINPDLLGMNDKRQEPGIVVQLRQQQGMAILRPVFAAYNKMREEIFKRLVSIVMSHMPRAQILKILGEPGRFRIDNGMIVDTINNLSANLNAVSNAKYDIDAEPESSSTTQNALELATYMEMNKNGFPVDPKVIVGKTNLPVSEKLSWIKFIEQSQAAASEAAKAEMDLKLKELEMKRELELAKIEANVKIASTKASLQREKDIMKTAVDQEKLRLQDVRDRETAKIKMKQIMSQAALGQDEARREWKEMAIRADIDQKRLILDVVEVMAQSRNSQTAEGVKASIEMYKAAINSKDASEERKLKAWQSILDAYITMDVEKGKMALENTRQRSDIAKSVLETGAATRQQMLDAAVREHDSARKAATDLEKERIKAKTSEKVADKQAEAAKVTAKENAKASAAAAKQSSVSEKKNKPL